MSPSTKLIDFSAWTGNWPFMKLRYSEGIAELKRKLESLKISRAFIAPTEAILEQDPTRANKALLASIQDDFFSPVPIVDLSYDNWKENVESAIADGRVKIIKLLPNYHLYQLDENKLAPLVELTQKHRIILSIQMRVEDRRGMYPLLNVPDIDVIRAVKAMSYFPEQRFILSNIYIYELNEVWNTLENVWVDLSSLDQSVEIVPRMDHKDIFQMLRQNDFLGRTLFATHAPFYFPEGSLYKLKYADASSEEIELVAWRNAEQLLAW